MAISWNLVKVVEIIKKIKITNKTSIKGMRLISGSAKEKERVERPRPLLGERACCEERCWSQDTVLMTIWVELFKELTCALFAFVLALIGDSAQYSPAGQCRDRN